MARAADFTAVARLDLAEVLRSRWLWFCAGIYAVLGGVFVLVGMRESALLGFTGMGRVLMSLCHGLTLFLPLLALTATGQVVNRSREDGTLEYLFSQPFRRTAYYAGVTVSRLAVLVLPLALLLVVMALAGQLVFGHEVPWFFLGRALAVSTALLAAFVGLGMAVSTWVRSQAKAATYILLLWAASVALLDFGLIGLMLQWRMNPQSVFLLASLNPVQAARMALLAGAEPELATLGPVGFFLSTRIGSDGLFALGAAWPAVLGCAVWLFSLRRFNRTDVV